MFAADADLWEVLGLCHDLDFLQTGDNLSQGLLTIKWLGDPHTHRPLQLIVPDAPPRCGDRPSNVPALPLSHRNYRLPD
jgi:hypothetical protein